MTARRVAVDDTDPQITWNGPWYSTHGVTDDPWNNGPPFLQTLHGISTNGSLSFSFYGSRVTAWGTLQPHNTSSGPDPFWQCIVDGRDIGVAVPYPVEVAGNYPFCAGTDITEGNHTFQLNAIIETEVLWVDQIQYQAAPSVDISNSWIEVPQIDSRISFSDGWMDDGKGYAKWTYVSGASLTYDFNGDAIIWGGYTPDDPTGAPGLATYTIDGKQPPIPFTIPAGPGIWSNEPFFNVSGLKPGPHRLQVVNRGNTSTVPMGVAFIYTRNTPQLSKGGKNGAIIGEAVGGSVGGLLLVFLIAFLVLCIRRRRRRRRLEHEWNGGNSTMGSSRVDMASSQGRIQTPSTVTQTNENNRLSTALSHNSAPMIRHTSWTQPQYATQDHVLNSQTSQTSFVIPSRNPSFVMPTISQNQLFVAPAAAQNQTFVPPALILAPQNQQVHQVLQPLRRGQVESISDIIPMQHTDGKPDPDEFNPYRQ